MTDVPDQVRVALARAFSPGPDGQERRLQGLLEVLTLSAAGNPVPSPATVRTGSLVRDSDERWCGALLVAEFGVFASEPVEDGLIFLPWHNVTAFAPAPGAPGACDPTRRPKPPFP
jgi:hypothetical protein